MSQTLYLRDGIHLAVVGDDLIALDTDADAYGCLPGLGAAIRRDLPDSRVEIADAAVAGQLIEAGLIGPVPQSTVTPALPPIPTRSAWRTERVAIAPSDLGRMAKAYVRATPDLWRSSFRKLLFEVARERPREADTSPGTIQRDAQAFDQLMPFVPFQGECLFRSRLLLAFLRTEGRDATWVFGVRTYPFQAHCWLQAGDTVLDDAAERVCGYMPILAV
jgi:hypothetical protein